MPIYNTPRLSVADVNSMNAGLRPFVVPIGERDALAEFYGVGVRTVERWFAPEGSQYRRCVPLRNSATQLGAVGRRIFQMFDDTNRSGWGDGAPVELEDGSLQYQPLQNMRLRIFLAACLGVDGGLTREAIYHGPERQIIEWHATLAACVERINAVYTGNATYFDWKAWTRFEIDYEPKDGRPWKLTVTYNELSAADKSDAEEEETEELEGQEIE